MSELISLKMGKNIENDADKIEENNKPQLTGYQRVKNSQETIIALIIYTIFACNFFVMITPTYYCCAKWWELTIIGTLFLITNLIMIYLDIVKGALDGLDSKIIDTWTIVHFLAGCLFGVTLPFLWMQPLNIGWEILEFCTKGLGDMEILSNRIMDTIAVTMGWFVVVLPLYYQDRFTMFPWILGNHCHDWFIFS